MILIYSEKIYLYRLYKENLYLELESIWKGLCTSKKNPLFLSRLILALNCIARHVDAGYEEAMETARKKKVKIPV